MNDNLNTQVAATSTDTIRDTRREWVKPEAKTADVSVATLSGGPNPPVTDFGSCAS